MFDLLRLLTLFILLRLADVRCANVGPPESLRPVSLYAKTLGACVLGTLL